MGEKLEAVTRADIEKIEAWLGGYARDPWVPDQSIKRLVRAWNAATPDRSDDALAEENRRLREATEKLVASLDELLGPLEQASAQLVEQGKPLNEAGEAAFDRAWDAIANGLAALKGHGL